MHENKHALKLPDFGLVEPSELTPAAQRILDAASRLFYWYGIHAVGVARIEQEASVTKKTIFDRFGSKERLVAEYLRRRDQTWRRRLKYAVQPYQQASDARGVILATFDALEHWVTDENPRGCAFVNALAEITSPEHEGHAVVMQQKAWIADYFFALAEQSEMSDAKALSEQLLILYEGATVVNALGRYRRPVLTARATAAQLIPSA